MPDKKENTDSSGPSSSLPTEAKDTGQAEQFPPFTALERKPSHKYKSLSASNMVSQLIVEDLTTAIDRMKSESPPLSLDQVRQRRASVKDSAKEQRKASIDLIRSRTASRASASGGRPNLEDITRSD